MQHNLRSARVFAKLMDSQFSFLGIRFGIENLIGLFPGVGDFLSLLLSTYLIWVGYQMKLPTYKLIEMIFNIIIDSMIGTIPLLGDIGDLFYKANIKNLHILEQYDTGEIIEGEIITE